MSPTIEPRPLLDPKTWSSKKIECDVCGYVAFIRVDPTATVVNGTYGYPVVPLRDRAAAVKGFASMGTSRVCFECFEVVQYRACSDPSVKQALTIRDRLAAIEEVKS